MENPYQAPTATVDDVPAGDNNSGGGKSITLPPGVGGWSWGAFLLNWIWGLFNRSYIGLLIFLPVPLLGFLIMLYLGVKGREIAWRNKRWDSFEHFNSVQKRWSWWSVVLFIVPMGIGILAAIVLPMFAKH